MLFSLNAFLCEMAYKEISKSVTLIDSPYHGERGVLGSYLVKGEKNVIIDPGPASQTPGVLEALHRLGVKELEKIALTHIHLDHAAGCWRILNDYPETKILCHPRGVKHMADPTQLKAAAYQVFGEGINDYGEIKGVPSNLLEESNDGDVLDLGGVILRVLWTPGHSTHSQSYFEPESKVAIVGDASGHLPPEIGFIIPTSPPPFNPKQAMESVELLIDLNPEVLCISHFGVHSEAVKILSDYKDLLERWTKIITEGVDEGLNTQGLYMKLLSEEPALKLAVKSEAAKSAVYGSIVGFREYVKWVRKKA
jgi:glyoxylase-like metal-dependent hydrolase (beta-lactamase superfamily II)